MGILPVLRLAVEHSACWLMPSASKCLAIRLHFSSYFLTSLRSLCSISSVHFVWVVFIAPGTGGWYSIWLMYSADSHTNGVRRQQGRRQVHRAQARLRRMGSQALRSQRGRRELGRVRR